jgi:hypothetical protein
VAERGLPYGVPELEYVAVEQRSLARMRANMADWWGDQTPIALCARCGLRYTEDPNRDAVGKPMHQDPEDDDEVVCEDCLRKGLGEALEADLLYVLEDKLGLAEKHRDALKLFIETIFTDPQKILQMQDLNNRVRELEKQTDRLWTVYVGAILALLVALAALVISVVT